MHAIILATNSGYSPHVADAFLNNLRAVGYDQKVELFDVPQDGIPICTRRLFAYLKFLREHPHQFRTVILSDLRDVLFQDNPLKIHHGTLDCFLEDESVTIGSCPFNSAWIRQGFGESALRALSDKPVSCAGFTIGTQAGIEFYLEAVLEQVEIGKQLFPGADQGIHNWLIHNGHLPCTLHPNESAPVYTVGYVPGIIVKNHRILNRQGIAPIVVHQYDRHLSAL